MNKNNVWDCVDKNLDKDGRVSEIDSKLVFKKKVDENGKVPRKARLMIQGFKDTNLYKLLETYAPVTRMPLVRALRAIANKLDLELCQTDVKTAFLNGDLTEDIYMKIPEGLNVSERVLKTKVYKLKKSLYGLCISPKESNKKYK